jgi:hypothetical protein
MSANTMAITQIRVSYLTSSLANRNSWIFTNQSQLQKSNSRIMMHGKLSIKSIALNDKVA